MKIIGKSIPIFTAVCLLILSLSLGVTAIGGNDLYASTPYVGFMASPGKTYQLDINIENNSTTIRQVALGLGALPAGYQAYYDTNGRVVTDLFLKPESSVFTKLFVLIPEEVPDGETIITATFTEGESVQEIHFKLQIEQKSIAEGEGKLSVQFPELSGTPSTDFTFRATYHNDTSNLQAFSLSSKAPEGWIVSFKPMYEDKNVASISVDAGGSQVLDINVKPPSNVAAGTYEIAAALVSPQNIYTVDLRTVIVGTYESVITTMDGRLNFDAAAGSTAIFPITVVNTGSAPLQDLRLSAVYPKDWAVSFDMAVIDEIPKGGQQQVLMAVKPTGRAIAGEYMVTPVVSNLGIKVSTDLRVMVKTPVWWGFLGLFIIAVIVVMLVFLFKKYGRR